MTARAFGPVLALFALVGGVQAPPSGGYQVFENPFSDPAHKAAFTYHSSVTPEGAGEFVLENYIRNDDPKEYLLVKWDDGGILCAGVRQLAPNLVNRGKYSGRILHNPVAVSSAIRYGGSLQYSTAAQVYIEPRAIDPPDDGSKTSGKFVSEFTQSGPDGRPNLRLTVTSTLDESFRSATLTVEVQGKVLLAIPSTLGQRLERSSDSRTNQTWKVTELSVDKAVTVDAPSQAIANSWFAKNSVTQSAFSLESLTGDVNRMTFKVGGSAWGLKPVYVIMLSEDRKGFIGFIVRAHVPGAPAPRLVS